MVRGRHAPRGARRRRTRELDALEPVAADDATPADPVGGDALDQLQARAGLARAQRATSSPAARDEAREAWTATRAEAEALETSTATRRRDRGTARGARGPDQRGAARSARTVAGDALDAERAELGVGGPTRRGGPTVRRRQPADRAEAERGARRVPSCATLERDHGGAAAELSASSSARPRRRPIEASRRDEALAALARERELALEGIPETASTPHVDEIDALDDEALEAELRRVRRTLTQIGSVNPFAVEEHREVAARLDEMTAPGRRPSRGDRLDGGAHRARSIAQIGEQFDAAFRAIGEKFDEYCQLLFAGGSASLQMADEADGDAPGGIEIVVRPPGKRLQRLAMLSGGERALTGVALLFAMLTVNPVPFCILDEVDAALDEANIGRFADALRRLAESIDFVVITHNRATIEVADTIYGVTMTDAAVSRVLSLRLADVPARGGAWCSGGVSDDAGAGPRRPLTTARPTR